jgi:citrate synthase
VVSPRKRPISSGIAHSTTDRIQIHGLDLATDLIGVVGLGDMAFLELKGRLPERGESVMINALLVALVEHGLTPSALAARMTLHGAPEALQGAIASGLLGLGDTYVGSIEGAARMLQEGLSADGQGTPAIASRIVAEHRARGELLPGIGHPVHRHGDPRSQRLFAIAETEGVAGRHVELMRAIGVEAEAAHGRSLPVNVTGAIGAIASDLQIPWRICRSLGVMARAVGLPGHLLEEMEHPIAGELWRRVEEESAGLNPS